MKNALRFDVRDNRHRHWRAISRTHFPGFQQADGHDQPQVWRQRPGVIGIEGILAVARGSVSVASEPGKGSVFSVTLPLAVQEGTVTAKLDVIGHMSEPEHAVRRRPPALLRCRTTRRRTSRQWHRRLLPLNRRPGAAPTANFAAPQPISDDRANRKRPDRVILAIGRRLAFRAHPARTSRMNSESTSCTRPPRHKAWNSPALCSRTASCSMSACPNPVGPRPCSNGSSTIRSRVTFRFTSSRRTDHADVALHLGAIATPSNERTATHLAGPSASPKRVRRKARGACWC